MVVIPGPPYNMLSHDFGRWVSKALTDTPAPGEYKGSILPGRPLVHTSSRSIREILSHL